MAQKEKRVTRSTDGTPIGYVEFGSGPPVVIVHGSLGTHEDWLSVAQELSGGFTCCVMDRRGRGMSGDAPDHSIDLEVDDIQAVLAAAGPEAHLVGHSHGAALALLAALRTPVPRLVLYEPPWPVHGPVHTKAIALCPPAIERGELDEALTLFLLHVTKAPPGLLTGLRNTPAWRKMAALTPTLVREMTAIDGLGPSLERFATLKAPTLLLLGALTRPPHLRDTTLGLAKIVPQARIVELEGQAHMANALAPQSVAKEIARFLAARF